MHCSAGNLVEQAFIQTELESFVRLQLWSSKSPSTLCRKRLSVDQSRFVTNFMCPLKQQSKSCKLNVVKTKDHKSLMYIQLYVYISTDPENNVILPVDLTFVVNVEYMYVSIFTSHRQHRIVCKKGEKRSISLVDKAIKLSLLHRQSDICYCFYTLTCLWQCLKDQYSPGEYLMALIWDFPTWTVIMCIPFFAFSTKNLPATEPTATQRPRLSTASAVVGFFKNKKINDY